MGHDSELLSRFVTRPGLAPRHRRLPTRNHQTMKLAPFTEREKIDRLRTLNSLPMTPNGSLGLLVAKANKELQGHNQI